MFEIAELACLILIYPDFLAGKISYHVENETVILPCQQLTDKPIWYGPPNLTIYAIGVNINSNLSNMDRFSIVHSDGSAQNDLRIRYFSNDDEGQYKCFRRSKTGVKELYFNLKKTKAPSNLTIEKEDLKQTVYGYWNKLFDLTCTIIQGIPTGKLMWIANNVTLVESGKSSVVHSFKPQKKDHLKQFTCETRNNITDMRLQRSVQFFVYMPPSVWIHPDHNLVIVHEGDDLIIYCNYSSNSNITDLKWNRLLTMKSQLWTSQYSPDLFIRNIQRGHAGQYICTVANMAGNGSDSITVKVNSPLKAPQNIMAVAFSDKIIVKWTSDLEIGPQETFVVEYRKLVESAWSQVFVEDRCTAVINGLVADTVYLVRVYSRTASRKSDRTDNFIVKTEKQHFTGFILPLEFAVILGGVLLIPYLFFCGMKVFKNRPNFRRNSQRVHHEHRHAETSVQPAHYDEIDSMYYNPINEALSRQNIRSNTQLMPSTSNAIFEIGQTDNSSSEIITPSISHQVEKSSQENASPGSSSDESYLVPCRNYIDFDITDIPGNQRLEINVDEPEIPKDESSVSSDNSETNIKIFRKYESLKGSNVNEHCYKNCNDIDV